MSTLAPGARLGPYEIRGPIGAGGMGEVFEATDTRLDRTVAIKVLASFWTGHHEMKERFDREAQTIASLNHPNICVLHDVGQHNGLDYLVMERLEGDTLAARLEHGPLSLEDALKIAVAIADALDKAHRRGVIHRDLKPSNVMLTATGPKLLDFGLAKFAPLPAQPGSSVVQTRADLSGPGTVLGTLQYMSPEQLEGGEADARTDIFAFGALVHEMITGKRAFEGRSRVLLISAIATSHPEPLSTFNGDVPPALDHIVRTCLAKEPADRWQTARDLLAELRWVAAGGADDAPALAEQRGWKRYVTRSRVGAAAAIIAAVGISVPALMAVRSAAPAPELRVRVPIQLTAQADGLPINGVANGALMRPASFALSADGRMLAFVARTATGEPFFLYVRPVGGVAPVRIAGTEDAAQPFWSADGRSIGFLVGARLRKVDVAGGQPQEIGAVPDFFGGTWNTQGVILFGSSQGVFRVRAEGGTPELILKPDKAIGGLFWPRFLPDGRRFVYTAWAGEPEQRGIHLATLGSADTSRILPAQSNAGVTSTGYLVYSRGNIVYAQRFDADGSTVSGEPARLADEVVYDTANGRSHFALSDTGTLAYFYNRNLGAAAGGGASSDLGEWQYSWVNRTGQMLATVGPWGAYRGIDVSPDTARVAVHRHDAKGGDIWILEPRGSETHLTFDTGRHNSMPIWSPDGREIVYASQQKGKWGLYRTLSSGSGVEQLLYESEHLKAPSSWRGSSIVFWVQDPKTGGDLWVFDLESKKAAPFQATPFNEMHAQISPDGKWIAFTSNQRDNRNEVYVRPFPTGSGLWQVTDAGGDWPRWKGDSREIYFHSIGNPQSPSTSFGNGSFPGPLSAIKVDVVDGIFQHDPPQQLLIFPAINVSHTGGEYHNYAVSPDGERFLVPQYVPSTGSGAGELGADLLSGLTVVVNWALP